ncbi:MAG: hypothetical protein DME19_10740 [Verrucomicrobia bacterium]|nr:MAG: hypothetical protein DME19_10740 [Verrucomicrobiota bacterium]
MKKFFKWVFRVILVVVLLVLVLILFLDPIAKSLAERQIRAQTGLDAKVDKLSIGLRTPTVAVLNFKLYNPPEFGGSTFIDIPELRVQYDLQGLRSKKVRLNLVRLNLGELHIVQNKDGKTNLRALQERQKQKPSPTSGESKVQFEGIDTLTLAIGRLKFTSEKNPALNEEIYVGYKNETVKNVKSWKDLEPLIARLQLEKEVKFLSQDLLKPGTNVLQDVTRPAEKEVPKAVDEGTDPLKKK